MALHLLWCLPLEFFIYTDEMAAIGKAGFLCDVA